MVYGTFIWKEKMDKRIVLVCAQKILYSYNTSEIFLREIISCIYIFIIDLFLPNMYVHYVCTHVSV